MQKCIECKGQGIKDPSRRKFLRSCGKAIIATTAIAAMGINPRTARASSKKVYVVDSDKCQSLRSQGQGCSDECISQCTDVEEVGAISLNNGVASIDPATCTGCGSCSSCPAISSYTIDYYVIKSEDCTSCGNCLDVCPVEAIKAGIPYSIETETCVFCGVCVSECPTNAIVLPAVP